MMFVVAERMDLGFATGREDGARYVNSTGGI
jgi:hypothetical protein